MDWMRRQDVKEESREVPNTLTPEDDDECYFEEDTSIDEGMVREISPCRYSIRDRLRD
jgi:hypothetical protein